MPHDATQLCVQLHDRVGITHDKGLLPIAVDGGSNRVTVTQPEPDAGSLPEREGYEARHPACRIRSALRRPAEGEEPVPVGKGHDLIRVFPGECDLLEKRSLEPPYLYQRPCRPAVQGEDDARTVPAKEHGPGHQLPPRDLSEVHGVARVECGVVEDHRVLGGDGYQPRARGTAGQGEEDGRRRDEGDATLAVSDPRQGKRGFVDGRPPRPMRP